MKRVILSVLLVGGFLFSQKLSDDPVQVKDALLESILYQKKQAEQIDELTVVINRIATDLKKIETAAQLDSLKEVYKLKD